MHPAKVFFEKRTGRLAAIFQECGLALIIGVDGARTLVAHSPVIFEGGSLRFHPSAANPLGKALATGSRALAVATGPDVYISPDWYQLSDQVPTWNYLSAEAEGPVRVLDRGEAVVLLDDLAGRFEAALAPKPPWRRDKKSAEKFEAMLGGVIAFELRIERLEGIAKLSQNKPPETRKNVIQALRALGGANSLSIASRMAPD